MTVEFKSRLEAKLKQMSPPGLEDRYIVSTFPFLIDLLWPGGGLRGEDLPTLDRGVSLAQRNGDRVVAMQTIGNSIRYILWYSVPPGDRETEVVLCRLWKLRRHFASRTRVQTALYPTFRHHALLEVANRGARNSCSSSQYSHAVLS